MDAICFSKIQVFYGPRQAGAGSRLACNALNLANCELSIAFFLTLGIVTRTTVEEKDEGRATRHLSNQNSHRRRFYRPSTGPALLDQTALIRTYSENERDIGSKGTLYNPLLEFRKLLPLIRIEALSHSAVQNFEALRDVSRMVNKLTSNPCQRFSKLLAGVDFTGL